MITIFFYIREALIFHVLKSLKRSLFNRVHNSEKKVRRHTEVLRSYISSGDVLCPDYVKEPIQSVKNNLCSHHSCTMNAIKLEPDSECNSSQYEDEGELPEPFTFVAVKEEIQDGDAYKDLSPKEEKDVLLPSVDNVPYKDDPNEEIKNKYITEDCNSETSKEGNVSADQQATVLNAPVCKKELSESGEIIKNVELSYKCELCKSSFATHAYLEIHRQIHEKVFRCENCGKYFAEKGVLTIHQRSHTGEKPYKCDCCGKCFSQKGNLDMHTRIHTGARPFDCDVCGKSFRQKSYVAVHRRTHTGEKPFQCMFCKKCFSLSGKLTMHVRTHTGEKPFKCEMCDKPFTRSGDLAIHRRIHTGQKPYKCDVCDRGFVRSGDLGKHQRTHTAEEAGM